MKLVPRSCTFFAILLWFAPWAALQAQVVQFAEQQGGAYLARIELHTAEELHGALVRAEALFDTGKVALGVDKPIEFILHGPEARLLLKSAYGQNKSLVDLAAKLSALGVVNLRVCKRWLGGQALDETLLMPFVGTVNSGPDEITRLQQNMGYVYF